MLTEITYNNRNNTIDLSLKADRSAVDLSSVTRMVLALSDGTEIDSDEAGAAFDWDTGTTGKIIIALGEQTITAGKYKAVLYVYDPTNTLGLRWDRFNLIRRGINE